MEVTAIGRYRIERVVGRGGMGVVYSGWDPALQRNVAIKVLGDNMAGAGRARLLREARAMAKLSHPNVITVFEVATDNGRDFLAMELVDGNNLAEWLTERHSQDEIKRVFVDAGRGLAAAHAAGMIHRDFKPHNILVRRDGRALVTDFGLARLDLDSRPSSSPLSDAAVSALVGVVRQAGSSAPTVDENPARSPTVDDDPARSPTVVDTGSASDGLTRAGAILGTPGYMAPEQYRGVADTRSDQFAYCVALWEALAGVPPFPGATREDFVTSIERGPTGEVTGRLGAIVRRGLASEPRDRWPSMDALLRALEPRRTRAWWVGGAAAVAVAAAAVVIGSTLSHDSAPPGPITTSEPPPPPSLLDGGRVRHLTVDDGCEEFPSFTPDGNTIVYDGLVGRAYEIFSVDVATGAKHQLTHDNTWSFKSAVSPDGRKVAFLRRDQKDEGTYLMDLAGGSPKRIGRGGLQPIWSADSSAVWLGNGEASQLVNVATGAITRSVHAPATLRPQQGVLLPDGRLAMLMFPMQGDQTATGVGVFDGDGRWTWLTKTELVEAIAVAPDGKAVLVSHLDEAGTRELWRVGLDGKATPMAGPVQPASGIATSPRGNRIAWSDCESKTTLATLAGDPLTPTHLPSGNWVDQAPAAVPNGTHAVVLSDRDGALRAWVIDLARNDPPRALPATREIGSVAVSTDGTTVYSVDDDGTLLGQPLDGSGPPVQIIGHAEGTPAPRRDGSIAIVIDHELVLVPPHGKPSTLVAGAAVPAASPVGDDLYYVTVTDHDKGSVMHRDGAGRTRVLSNDLAIRPWRVITVSADGKRVAAIETSKVSIVDVTSGRIVGSYDAGAGMLTGAAFVGSTLVVSHVEFQGDVWLLDH